MRSGNKMIFYLCLNFKKIWSNLTFVILCVPGGEPIKATHVTTGPPCCQADNRLPAG
jgi:hypothetical protein